MILEYNQFKNFLDKKIKSGEDFYLELLETVIKYPSRYCGLFRLSNAKTKLIQNVTQSKEIKFGDFMEDISTEYIKLIGYENLHKDLGEDENGDRLNCDQLFRKGTTIYFVEQKVRDDHDSTKKRGQYENFCKKVKLIKKKFSSYHIIAIMWFIDDNFEKNKNYYAEQIKTTKFENTELHLYYGGEFFCSLNNGKLVWDEIIEYLTRIRMANSSDIFTIPDFGTNDEIYKALLKLPHKYWEKLISNDTKYELLRKELFSNGDNIEKAKKNR